MRALPSILDIFLKTGDMVCYFLVPEVCQIKCNTTAPPQYSKSSLFRKIKTHRERAVRIRQLIGTADQTAVPILVNVAKLC